MSFDQTDLRLWRCVALFLGGFFGAMYEIFIDNIDRPSLLILLAGMMGLPAFMERRKPNGNGKKEP